MAVVLKARTFVVLNWLMSVVSMAAAWVLLSAATWAEVMLATSAVVRAATCAVVSALNLGG